MDSISLTPTPTATPYTSTHLLSILKIDNFSSEVTASRHFSTDHVCKF